MATIKKQGRGYKITVSNGYDIHGKQIRHHLTWVPESNLTERQVERELNRQIVLFEESVKTGGIRLDGNIRFQAFSERFMRDHIAVNRKPNTAARYERDLKRINKAIGHMKLSHITPSDINAFAASLQADGAKGSGGKLAPSRLLTSMHSPPHCRQTEQKGLVENWRPPLSIPSFGRFPQPSATQSSGATFLPIRRSMPKAPAKNTARLSTWMRMKHVSFSTSSKRNPSSGELYFRVTCSQVSGVVSCWASSGPTLTLINIWCISDEPGIIHRSRGAISVSRKANAQSALSTCLMHFSASFWNTRNGKKISVFFWAMLGLARQMIQESSHQRMVLRFFQHRLHSGSINSRRKLD